MKNVFYLLVLIAISSCSSTRKSTVASTVTDFYNCQKTISVLSSDKMDGRVVGTQGIESAANYIASELSASGIQPFFNQSYRDSFKIDDIDAYNIVGVIKSKIPSDEYILLGAHYDHVDEKKYVKGDTIYNGANDNASGVTIVLEIAKELVKHNSDIKKNVIIALFSGEETGLDGSKHLAAKMKEQDINLSYLINFEMVGVPLTVGTNKVYITGYKMSDMYSQINTAVNSEFVVFEPNSEAYGLFERSDNFPFFQAYGIPSQTISSFDFKNYDFYHHVDDEVKALDLKHIDSVINLSSKAILHLLINNIEITGIKP